MSDKPRLTINLEGSQDLGCTQTHPEKSSIFKPVARATKVMKIGLKATQNHEKWTLKPSLNLSCQKTESTIVLAMFPSTGKSQLASSHKTGTEDVC